MTHTVLTAMKGRAVFLPRRHVLIKWPEPGSIELTAPLQRAREFYDLFIAYFDVAFPMYDVQVGFAAFNLSIDMQIDARVDLIKRLAHHVGVDGEKAGRAFKGASGGSTGAWARAVWHGSPVGQALAHDSHKSYRDPENKNLRAWIRTLRDLRQNPTNREDLIVLIEDFLIAVPGTATVERWLSDGPISNGPVVAIAPSGLRSCLHRVCYSLHSVIPLAAAIIHSQFRFHIKPQSMHVHNFSKGGVLLRLGEVAMQELKAHAHTLDIELLEDSERSHMS